LASTPSNGFPTARIIGNAKVKRARSREIRTIGFKLVPPDIVLTDGILWVRMILLYSIRK
jgi:hypothetical protein